MYGGSAKPISSCDGECSRANGCAIGGKRCEGCGLYFCALELDENGMCDDCAEEQAAREEEADD